MVALLGYRSTSTTGVCVCVCVCVCACACVLRVIVSRMVEIVADTGRDEDSPVLDGQLIEQTTQVDKAVHHLRDAEAVAEVVERVVSVVLLNAQLHTPQTYKIDQLFYL